MNFFQQIDGLREKAIVFFAILFLIFGGYFGYQEYRKKNIAEFDAEIIESDFERKIPSRCEGSEWVEFPKYEKVGNAEKFAKETVIKMANPERFTDEDGSVVLVTDDRYSLAFFADKRVRVEGWMIGSSGEKSAYVQKIRCVGEESREDVRLQRQRVMQYIADNINVLALEKNRESPWRVQTFYFVDNQDVYVEYESPASIMEEAPYDARLWLVRIKESDRNIPVIETLAYIEEDPEDPEKNRVKYGSDMYANVTGMTVYEFDEESQKWMLQ